MPNLTDERTVGEILEMCERGQKVTYYLVDAAAGAASQGAAPQAGFLTPYKDVNLDVYIDDTQRGLGSILLGADTFRFDASDLMPAAVGQGSFWTGMVDYVGGESAEDVAKEIQASWDAAK